MAPAICVPVRLSLVAVTLSISSWLARSCSTENANLLTTGAGVRGNTCSGKMEDGGRCEAICSGDSTVVGTLKCVHGSLQDVSMCVPNHLLHDHSVVDVTKVLGALKVELDKEPSDTQITDAVVAGFGGMPRHYLETVWIAAKSGNNSYTVKYWVIVKPGQHPDVIVEKAKALPLANTTNHQKFKASLESNGIMLSSISVAAAATPVQSRTLKDSNGQNVNPFQTFENLGVNGKADARMQSRPKAEVVSEQVHQPAAPVAGKTEAQVKGGPKAETISEQVHQPASDL